VAPAAGRGARGGQGRIRRGRRGLGRADGGLRAYNVSGIRPEADFFLWQITERYDDLLELGAALNGTPLAGWLTTPYSYLATTKPSVYTDKKRVARAR
jgi:chlorite dismutase